MAQTVALILHELSTNAAKHGSLSVPKGLIDVRWSPREDGRFVLDWIESGGPSPKPTRQGFGASIIDQMVRALGGEIRLDWRAEGLACRIVPSIVTTGDQRDEALRAALA